MMTDKEMAEELWKLAHYLGRDGNYHKTLKKIARRLDPLSVMVPVTEAHVGCVVCTSEGEQFILSGGPWWTNYTHPEHYKIAITHRHDRSAECPVDPDDCVIVQRDRAGYVFTDVASDVPWAWVIGYSILDVVPLQGGE